MDEGIPGRVRDARQQRLLDHPFAGTRAHAFGGQAFERSRLDRRIQHRRRIEVTADHVDEPQVGDIDAGDRHTERCGAALERCGAGVVANSSDDEAPGSHGQTLLS